MKHASKNNKIDVLIFVASEYKGFLLSLGSIFSNHYFCEVTILCRDGVVEEFVKENVPNLTCINLQNISINNARKSIHEQAAEFESNYRINISMLMSEDRALGQGYLFNVSKVPNIQRSTWPYKDKLECFLSKSQRYEAVLKGRDIVISMLPDKTLNAIARYHGAKTFSFVMIKHADRWFWSDDDYLTSTEYKNKIKYNLAHGEQIKGIPYVIDEAGDKIMQGFDHSLTGALLNAMRVIYTDSKNFIRGVNKKNSYRYLGWLPSLFRKVFNYKFIEKNSFRVTDLSRYKIVYFPLHLEPEVALLSISPELNNSMEIISWISKSLPSGYMLVIKENPLSLGVRPRAYYKQLLKIPNVLLAHPGIHSWEWIKNSAFVATITGTVGQEAVALNKPVVSFGKHQIINLLPTVSYVNNFDSCAAAFMCFINNPPSQVDLQHSSRVLVNSQIDCSISCPGLADDFRSNDIQNKHAPIAVKKLFEQLSAD